LLLVGKKQFVPYILCNGNIERFGEINFEEKIELGVKRH